MTAKSLTDKLLPFLTGVTVGVLGTLATFSGRVSALETGVANHTTQLTEVKTEISKLNENLISFLRR